MDLEIDKVVTEIQKVMKFKESTAEGDIVLLIFEKPQSLFYALVTDIERDMQKMDEWWHLSLQTLASVPPQSMIWTLRESQFTGKEIFTMGGEKRFMKAVDFFVNQADPVKKDKKPHKRNKPALRIVK